MTSREIIDGVITSINAQIAHRKAKTEELKKAAVENWDYEMIVTYDAQLKLLERIEKDLIQVEMNAKISYMGINTD